MNRPITPNNWLSFATNHYNNPSCASIEEFTDDLEKRPQYIRKLFRKYDRTGELRDRLIINHIVIYTNVFGVIGGVRLLFYLLEAEHHSLLKTFLAELDYLPDEIPEVDLNSLDIVTPAQKIIRDELNNT